MEKIKVLIVEDSPSIGLLLENLLKSDPALEVVGRAKDGAEAIRMVARLRPNVITMDVQMPGVDGIEATEYIMAHFPTPIMVLTASIARHDVDLSFKMLSAGALEIIEKPEASQWDVNARRLVERLKLLSRIKVITHIRGRQHIAGAPTRRDVTQTKPLTTPVTPRRVVAQPLASPVPPTAAPALRAKAKNFRALTIASSTGGPISLATVLGNLISDLPVPVFVVQHIPSGFAKGLAEWLNGESKLPVKIASSGEMAQPGTVYLPSDDHHLRVGRDGRIQLTQEDERMYLRPCADVTFESLAEAYPGQTLAVVLTGMGRDGTAGCRVLKAAGGYNIAQDEATSIIYGMPRSAVEAGVTDKVLPLPQIPLFINSIFGH